MLGNAFLEEVLRVEIVNILAVTTTVTLGVASILYFQINELIGVAHSRKVNFEDAPNRIARINDAISKLEDSKTSIRRTAFLLISIFGAVFFILTVRSWVPAEKEFVHAVISVFCFTVFLANILSMVEIHMAIFRLPATKAATT
jgi:hypothetical protein